MSKAMTIAEAKAHLFDTDAISEALKTKPSTAYVRWLPPTL